jgi:NADPH2:quinone reductase
VTTAPISWRATRLAETGKLTPRLGPGRFTLEGIADAYAAVRNQPAAGKIVIDID